MNGKMNINIQWHLFFSVSYTDNWKLKSVADHNNDFGLTITQQFSFY